MGPGTRRRIEVAASEMAAAVQGNRRKPEAVVQQWQHNRFYRVGREQGIEAEEQNKERRKEAGSTEEAKGRETERAEAEQSNNSAQQYRSLVSLYTRMY